MMQILKIGVVGASGKMGTEILRIIATSSTHILAGACVPQADPLLGRHASKDVLFSCDLESVAQRSDVLIDFSSSDYTPVVVAMANQVSIPLVCGVTGLADETLALMKARATKIFYAANMSLSVAIMAKAVGLLAEKLEEDFDIEISEMHHAKKIDAPSGTALFLGEAAARARHWKASETFCFQRSGKEGSRPHHQIGFSSIRGGNGAGSHTVFFLGEDELLSITHQSFSRTIFAKGALTASQWIAAPHAPGLYSMEDLLGKP